MLHFLVQAIDTAAYVSGAIILVLSMTAVVHHMWRECCVKMCQKENNGPE